MTASPSHHKHALAVDLLVENSMGLVGNDMLPTNADNQIALAAMLTISATSAVL